MKEDKYNVKFKCGNCGNVWFQKIPKGYKLKFYYIINSMIAEKEGNEEKFERIICPQCETSSEVRKDKMNEDDLDNSQE